MIKLCSIFLVSFAKSFIDIILSFAVIPAGYLLLFYRRVGSNIFPLTTLRLKKIGLFVIRDHYYEPLFNENNLIHPLDADRLLPGIDLKVPEQLELLSRLVFSSELIEMNFLNKDCKGRSFNIVNDSFESGDAEFLYQMIRYLKPKKIIEIGSGHSTKVARLAVDRNKNEFNFINHTY